MNENKYTWFSVLGRRRTATVTRTGGRGGPMRILGIIGITRQRRLSGHLGWRTWTLLSVIATVLQLRIAVRIVACRAQSGLPRGCGTSWHIFEGLAIWPDVLDFSNGLGSCSNLKNRKEEVGSALQLFITMGKIFQKKIKK